MASSVHSTNRVLIVGGGIAGLATATRLAQTGHAVTVLEQGRLGSGASTRNQGWLHSGALYAVEQPSIARLCLDSLHTTLEFCPACVEPEHNGALFLLSDETADRWQRAWKEAGIPFSQTPMSQVAEQIPKLAAPTDRHAFLLPDRSVRVDVLLKYLADAARRAGAEIRADTGVARLLRVRDEIRGVVTNLGEEITSRLVILAANIRNTSLLPELETGANGHYSLLPLKTHLIATPASPSTWPICFPDEDAFHHLPHPPGSVFGSGRWLRAADPSDDRPDSTEFEWIRDFVARLFPGLAIHAGDTIAWAGTTVQAVLQDNSNTKPSSAAWPVVIDHAQQSAAVSGVLSVFPGRATLWPMIAEETHRVVTEKLGSSPLEVSTPPWASEIIRDATAEPGLADWVDIFHCQKCGRVQRRPPALQPPVCCGAVMVRAADELFLRRTSTGDLRTTGR